MSGSDAPRARSPRPGSPVRGSRTGRPIMAAFDLLGRRWTMRVIWELHVAGRPLTFRELRARCEELSSSVLTRRLHELSEGLLVTHDGTGYVLTPSGQTLVASMQPLIDWSHDWGRTIAGQQKPQKRTAK